jgi:hypothetical protein
LAEAIQVTLPDHEYSGARERLTTKTLPDRSTLALFLGLLFGISILGPVPAYTEEELLARQIAERMISEESWVALMVASRDQIRKLMREKFSKHVDMSSVSDRDLDTYLKIATEIGAEAVVAGMRSAFTKKLEELQKKDQEILLSCLQLLPCDRGGFSSAGRTILEGMQAFGGAKGQEIGEAVGLATKTQLMEKLKSMDETDFDNRDALIRFLNQKTPRI